MLSAANMALTNRGHLVPNNRSTATDWSSGDLHSRIVAGDRSVVEDFAARMLDILRRHLRRVFTNLPEEILSDAAEDSLLDYMRRPHTFDPERGVPLSAFLYRAASRNVIDIVRRDLHRRARETTYAATTLLLTLPCATFALRDHETRSPLDLAGGFETDERWALWMWTSGECGVSRLAAALGVAHLSQEDQRREVKRFKDRAVKRLRRAAHSLRSPEQF